MKTSTSTLKRLGYVLSLGLVMLSCDEEAMNLQPESEVADYQSERVGDQVSIDNAGFESNFSGWIDTDPSAISSDAHSGSKSVKITGSAGKVEQTVTVQANTNYTLSAWVLGKGKIGVEASGLNASTSENSSDWTEVSLDFNSGSNTSIDIYGAYNGGTGRLDDFSLVEGEGSGGTGQLNVVNVTASANDGNVAGNTIDGNLGTRWSANGHGAYITYDLGSTKTVSSLKIAWFKGNERQAYFKIRAGASTSSLSTIYDGTSSGSSGSTLSLEDYDFSAVDVRYIRITGFGNSANNWNSITELEIYGSGGTTTDNTAPGAVSSLSANPGNESVTLSWNNPSDNDLDRIEIKYNNTTVSTTSSSRVITGLTNNTSYNFDVTAIDNSGNRSSTRSVSATPQGNTGTATIPSDLMENCNQWKITYPTGSEDKTLCGENNNEYFYINGEGNAIVFRVPIRSNNGSTPRSDYIRSELRERTEDGNSDVYWTTSGKHVLYVKQAITHLPMNKDHLVATQIHGNKSEGIDDAMVMRLEGSHLFLSFNGGKLRSDLTIKNNYSLGAVHEVIFEVINGKHYCYYSEDGNLRNAYFSGNASSYLVKDGGNSVLMDRNYGESYFKVGNYTQSNPEEEGSDTDNPNNYGEVLVYDFTVEHD